MKYKRSALIVEELNDGEVLPCILLVRALCLDFDELSVNGNSVAYLLGTHFLSALIWDRLWWSLCFQFRQCEYLKKAFCETLSTQAHPNMDSQLQYLYANAKVKEEDLESFGGFACQETKELCFFSIQPSMMLILISSNILWMGRNLLKSFWGKF